MQDYGNKVFALGTTLGVPTAGTARHLVGHRWVRCPWSSAPARTSSDGPLPRVYPFRGRRDQHRGGRVRRSAVGVEFGIHLRPHPSKPELLEAQPHHFDERYGGMATAPEARIQAEPDTALSAIIGVNPDPDETREPSRFLRNGENDAVGAVGSATPR